MKKIDFKNKKTTWWLIGLLVIVLLAIFFFKGLEGKSLNIWKSDNDSTIDIANSKDYSKYEGSVNASFEGSHSLDFSFLHNNDFKVVQGTGSQVRWFKLVDASSTNLVTLYFTYEGGRGWTAEDYVNKVLKTDDSVKIEDVKFADDDSASVKYVVDKTNNVEYYVEAIKGTDGDSWLAIVENKGADNDTLKAAAKDLMRSFVVTSKKVEDKTATGTPTQTATDTSTSTEIE